MNNAAETMGDRNVEVETVYARGADNTGQWLAVLVIEWRETMNGTRYVANVEGACLGALPSAWI